MCLNLPKNHRQKFAQPLGIVLCENDYDKKTLHAFLYNSQVITVGDTTTKKILNCGFVPFLQIIDNKEKRIAKKPIQNTVQTNLYCNNPPGQITKNSIKTIKMAFELPTPVRITVNGEEDLLVLPVCIYAPDNSIVLYGQPNEGLVIVKTNNEIRRSVLSLIRYMKRE